MYKLLTSTEDEYESGFVRNQAKRDSPFMGDHVAAGCGHMDTMVKMRGLLRFVKVLEEIIYGIGSILLLKIMKIELFLEFM